LTASVSDSAFNVDTVVDLFSQYPNVSILDFVGANGNGGGCDNWSYMTCKAPVKL